jgi:Na+/melibiose symporter-like transporter
MLKAHVSSICFKCFKCFRGMLQVFYADVTKVDRDVARVAIVVHVCCKLLFSIFHPCFLQRKLQMC